MRLATALTRALLGLKAPEVAVEAHVAGGLPQFPSREMNPKP